MGDFTGFTFGNVRSSDLGIYRVSGGDRYEEGLHPEIKDRTVEVPGLNGEYYFGSDYGTRTIDLEFAFDSVTEEQLRQIKKVFGTKQNKDLIFDETPYKKYIAKLASPVELSYVCFDEPKKEKDTARNGIRRDRTKDTSETLSFQSTLEISANSTISYELESSFLEDTLNIITDIDYIRNNNIITFTNNTEEDSNATISYQYVVNSYGWEEIVPWKYSDSIQRVYKGEGKISFICYFPFAKSVFKELPQGSEEWAISSGILSHDKYANIDSYNDGVINIYNAGDIETGFRLYIPASIVSNGITLKYKPDGINEVASLIIDPITEIKTNKYKTSDIGILIDTTNEIIAGVYQITGDSVITTSGNIYNEYISAGYFFHFEPNSKNDNAILEIEGGAPGIKIFYDYLYF